MPETVPEESERVSISEGLNISFSVPYLVIVAAECPWTSGARLEAKHQT